MKIRRVWARQILDSRGIPTVETDIELYSGAFGRAAVPSGASTGIYEAHELRDGGGSFRGKSVHQAVDNVNNDIANAISNIPADDQYKIDQTLIDLDGTENKSRLGANAILSVSLAVAKAAANERKLQLFEHLNDVAHGPEMLLPMPMLNVLNGGKHANNSSDFQEYMLVPKSATTYAQAIQMTAEVFYDLKKTIKQMGGSTTVGDEGGFTLPVGSNSEYLEILSRCIEQANYRLGEDFVFALDVAASEFYENGKYHLNCENRLLTESEMIDYLDELRQKFPIFSIEDGLEQENFSSWSNLKNRLHSIQIVGDDLLVTNQVRLQKAIELDSANAILIKLNQIGTLTETIQTIQLAQAHGWRTVVSHRSGETEDTTIAHLAVGLGVGQIKTGSITRGERTAKHNELLRISESNPNLGIDNLFES